jgi:opacity protein-like surface antigen
MKKLLVVLALFSLLSIPAFAQDEAPAFEIFGGYTLAHSSDWDQTGNGFAAALTGNVNKTFGVTGEFGFYDFDGGKGYTYMAGPQIGYRAGAVRPFGEALFGGTTLKGDGDASSESHFSMSFGGGLDLALSDKISIRPAKLDLLTIRPPEGGDWANFLRYSAGVVFKF